MKKTILLLFIINFSLLIIKAKAQTMNYYLPKKNVKYNPEIPLPITVLGHEVGEWHVTHDKLYFYMKALAKASNRITIHEFARSYENRPLLYLTITSPKNQGKIKEIQQQHLDLCNPEKSKDLDLENMPAILYQGYSIHGNEASGSNAAILYAYYLAAAQGKEIEKILEETVILLDPCFNPDGVNRFATWVNMHKSKKLNGNPNSRELNEAWPGGRTNHYWFDLNRDWLPVQHPESQGRIKNFHEWKPNILTDHHEMGSNATYFFQPGIPSRTNPLTPQKNQDLTAKIATYHAKFLDEIGSMYYSGESFDDFYYGKGSTYPDINGCIGILFEQASSRGHLHETINGNLTFPFTIKNQFTTSLSTLQAGFELRKELLTFQREFYKNAQKEAKNDPIKAFVFVDENDKTKTEALVKLLRRHEIIVHETTKDLKADGKTFKKYQAFLVPTNQPQYRLVKAMFEQRTQFQDSLFYDVSAWTLPLAFNMKFATLDAKTYSDDLLYKPKFMVNDAISAQIDQKSNYAYLFEWKDYNAPFVLNKLLEHGLIAKVASRPFTIETKAGEKTFDYGTILIPVKNQKLSSDEIYDLLSDYASSWRNVQVYGVSSGLTRKGIDLGSNDFKKIKKPEVLMLVGSGVLSYSAGEIWHLMDQHYEINLTMTEVSNLNSMDLSRYNSIVFVDGNYNRILAAGVSNLRRWTSAGGNLILIKNAISWAEKQGLANVAFKKQDKKENENPPKRPYESSSRDYGASVTGGAIFETKLDLSHPLAYGYSDETLPVFRRGNLFLETSENPYASPVIYTNTPLMAGYISDKNLSILKKSAAIIVSGYGSGKVICMADNPNFRAFWHGTNRLFINAVFFGKTINNSTTQRTKPKKK